MLKIIVYKNNTVSTVSQILETRSYYLKPQAVWLLNKVLKRFKVFIYIDSALKVCGVRAQLKVTKTYKGSQVLQFKFILLAQYYIHEWS